jgi:transcriptional regulator with XRE-family HTH domain
MIEPDGDLPARIKRYRKAHRESQTKFGARFKVKRLSVFNWEQGKPPNRGHFEELTKLLAEGDADAGFQLRLPFDSPIDLTIRLSPQPSTTIHFDVQIKHRAG